MPGLLVGRSTSSSRPSFSSPSPSPSSSPPPTLHRRRIMSRSNTSSPPPPALPASLFATTATMVECDQTKCIGKSKKERQARREAEERFDGDDIEALGREESDMECWMRMLALQREFHCYNSARLEAAVEALERGCSIEEVSIPSRLCLDLLNEGLRAQMFDFSRVKA